MQHTREKHSRQRTEGVREENKAYKNWLDRLNMLGVLKKQ